MVWYIHSGVQGVVYTVWCTGCGMFQLCWSDLGTQLKAGAAVISDFLEDFECAEYFREHGILKLTFNQYAKGNNALGSLVEVLVKQTKSLIIKSIGKVIHSYPQFYLLVARVNHVINRRPVTYNESLREGVECSSPEPITPANVVAWQRINFCETIFTTLIVDFAGLLY